MNGRGGLFEMWTMPGGTEESQYDSARLIPPALPRISSLLPSASGKVLLSDWSPPAHKRVSVWDKERK